MLPVLLLVASETVAPVQEPWELTFQATTALLVGSTETAGIVDGYSAGIGYRLRPWAVVGGTIETMRQVASCDDCVHRDLGWFAVGAFLEMHVAPTSIVSPWARVDAGGVGLPGGSGHSASVLAGVDLGVDLQLPHFRIGPMLTSRAVMHDGLFVGLGLRAGADF